MTNAVQSWRVALAVATLWGLPWVGESSAHPELESQISDVDGRIETEGPSAELFLRRAELHRIHGDLKAAMADLNRARTADPDLALVDYFIARVEFENGKLKPAGRHIDRFLGRVPDHSAALTIRARISMARGRTVDAIADYSRAIEASDAGRPEPGLYLERARAQQKLGRDAIPAAIEGLDRGAEALGQPITLAQFAIELELERGNHRGAIERIDRLAARAARQESWHLKRAEIYEQTGQDDDARREYDAALAALKLLPESRRQSRAMQRLEVAARAGLERLSASEMGEAR